MKLIAIAIVHTTNGGEEEHAWAISGKARGKETTGKTKT
jgi:hypothetical protein